jgi:alginate O-acetyltransferase complex protein AlgI
MLFPTVDFAVFFVLAFTGSWMLRPYPRPWRWFLLVASCIFYLDPFNPVATDGEQVVAINLVILMAMIGAGALTSTLLRVGFGSSADAAPPPRQDEEAVPVSVSVPLLSHALGSGGTGTGIVGSGPAEGDASVGTLPAPAARRSASAPLACFWVPVAVVAMMLAGNITFGILFPLRPDQSWRFLFLLLGVAFANQAFAQAVFAALGPQRRRTAASRALVWAAVAFDLAVLGYFKYVNWFLGTFEAIVSHLGFGVPVTLPLDIILPIAISFFTFQAISYVVDVGRGELRPIPLLDFTVYLTFFAHVVAGPIVRVREFAPQLNARTDPRYVPSAEAFELIFRGLFKKVVVSSYLAAQIVDPVFAAPGGFSRAEVAFGIVGYAIQIYADFSGYTDIAIGVALLLGIRFPQNFNAPYRALSLQDFWRRWHMTLSRWLRDYLYIPLGGSRMGSTRTYVNLFLTMLLGGLWHGANWTFVVWGAIHGFGMGLERWTKIRWALRAQERGPLGLPAAVVRTLQWALTFGVVCLAWVFFRATSVSAALEVLGQLFFGEATVGAVSRVTPVLVAVVGLSMASQFVPPRIPERITVVFSHIPPIVQVLCGAAALTLINVMGPEGIAPFIYFQF